MKPTPQGHLRIAQQGAVDVTLITYAGAKLALTISGPIEEFTYSGRLWALNHQYSAQAKSPVFVEVNAEVCREMRHNAGAIMQICARWEAQLESLKTKPVTS